MCCVRGETDCINFELFKKNKNSILICSAFELVKAQVGTNCSYFIYFLYMDLKSLNLDVFYKRISGSQSRTIAAEFNLLLRFIEILFFYSLPVVFWIHYY